MKRGRSSSLSLTDDRPCLRVVCAPNAFKECLSAKQVASAMAKGILRASESVHIIIDQVPLADGGDGTMQAIADSFPQIARIVTLIVRDPLGRPVSSRYCILDIVEDAVHRKKAIIETAEASGLWRLQESEKNPMHTSTFGTGELLLHALSVEKVDDVMLCLGGSATNDAGVGIATALGFTFYDQDNEVIESPTGKDLVRISSFTRPNKECESMLENVHIEAACDVENLLCGEQGAVSVYAGQKGATEEDKLVLEKGMENMARLWRESGQDVSDMRGSGAAGGLGGGLMAFLGAPLRPGFALVSDFLNFESYVDHADIVFSGEGSIDSSTSSGKVPHGVSLHCKLKGKPCFLVGGSIPESREDLERLRRHGATAIFSLASGPISLEHSREHAQRLLANTCENIMRSYLCLHQ